MRHIARRTAILAAFLLAAAGESAAQQQPAPAIAPGTRVRVNIPRTYDGRRLGGREWHTGTLVSISDTQISLRPDDRSEGEFTAPFTEIDRIEVSQGTQSQPASMRRGALRGTLGGAATGAGATLLARVIAPPYEEGLGCSGHDIVCHLSRPGANMVARNIAVGAVAGAFIGTVVGGRRRERWASVENPRYRVSLSPGGVSLRIATR